MGSRSRYFIDTHIIIWIFEGKHEKFSVKLQNIMETSELVISPMSVLELQYLHEKGKLEVLPNEIITEVQDLCGATISQSFFDDIIKNANELQFTRDAFDRIILAETISERAILISADRVLRSNSPKFVLWDNVK